MDTVQNQISVVVYAEYTLLRMALNSSVGSANDIEILAEIGDRSELLRILPDLRPKVVLLCANTANGTDIVNFTRELRELHADHILVILLQSVSSESVTDLLLLGTHGILTKEAGRGDIVQAIRLVAKGATVISPSIMRPLTEALGRIPLHQQELPDGVKDLSNREFDILKLLSLGYDNGTIARKLFISEATVRSHVSHLLAKLGVASRVQAVILCYRYGIVK